MVFVRNMLIEWQVDDGNVRIDRVLYLNPSTRQMVTICVMNQRELWVVREYAEIEEAIAAGKAVILDKDPYMLLDKSEQELSPAERKLRDKAWSAIAYLFENGDSNIFDPAQRGRLIAEAAIRAGTTRRVIYKYLRRYMQGGLRKNALLPHFEQCGAPGREKPCGEKKRGRRSKLEQQQNRAIGINVDAAVREKFRRGYKKYYLKENGPTLRATFQATLEDFFRTDYEMQQGVLRCKLPPPEKRPSFWQFRYWVNKERKISSEIIARQGHRTYNGKYRPLIGNSSKMAIGPGSLYMIDATITDYYLVNSFDPTRLLGRAVFYKVVDLLTWTIAGIDIGFNNASKLGAMLAIYNATRDKVAYCADHGVPIKPYEWPHKFVPEGLLADRGELLSDNADNIVGGLDLPVYNTPPYRGDLKYLVEQEFHRMNQRLLDLIPSAIYGKRERGDRDPRLDACLTPQMARQIAILDALDHNKNHRLSVKWLDAFMIEDQVERYPLDLWNWGMTYRAGHLRVMPDDLIRVNLLPQALATVTGHGICFNEMYYTCPTAEAEEWFVKARVRGMWDLPVVYDPRLPANIYLRLDNGRRLERCQRLERDEKFAGRDLEEIQDFFEGQQVLDQVAEFRKQDTTAELHDKVKDIVEPAQAAAKAARAGMSNNAFLKGMRENKQEAREEEAQENAWIFPADVTMTDAVFSNPEPDEESIEEIDALTDLFVDAIDLLEQITDEELSND